MSGFVNNLSPGKSCWITACCNVGEIIQSLAGENLIGQSFSLAVNATWSIPSDLDTIFDFDDTDEIACKVFCHPFVTPMR